MKSDKDIYIDVRKKNYLNIYYNGGSIMKLEGGKGYKAEIHYKYVPLQGVRDYLPILSEEDKVSFPDIKLVDLDNFSVEPLTKIKKRIKKYYPNLSETGIQGSYVIKNNHKAKSPGGFFIDTEFQYANGRIDMVWIDLLSKKIAFVELKTISDERLNIVEDKDASITKSDPIDVQLKRYFQFVSDNIDSLKKYYDIVFKIKRDLGIIPGFVQEDNLLDYEIIDKPILLIGDCTQKWIDNNSSNLNNMLSEIAFGIVYQGKTTFNFSIPYKTSRNRFRLSQI